MKNEEFRKMLHETFLNCQISKCQIMSDLLSASAMNAAFELRQELVASESRVSLAMDVWTTSNNLAFFDTFLWW